MQEPISIISKHKHSWQSQLPLETLAQSLSYIQAPTYATSSFSCSQSWYSVGPSDDYCQHCVNKRERSWTFIDACCVEQLRSLWLKTFQLALVPLDLGSSTCLACLLLGLLIVTMFQESFLPLPRIYLRVQ